MLKPFTLLVFGAATAMCVASPTDDRVSSDNLTSEGSSSQELFYYLDEEQILGTEGTPALGEEVVLRPPPPNKRGKVQASAETFLYWSNNIGNDETDEEEGWATGGRAGVRWRQGLKDNYLLDMYLFQDVYRYDVDNFDYESTEAGVGLVKLFPNFGGLTLFGRYEFLYIRADNPMTIPTDLRDNLHTRLHRLRGGVGKTVYETPRQFVYVGADARYDFDANPSPIRRIQYTGRVTWSYRLTDQLRATAFYRLSFRDYLDSPRNDLNQSAGLELSYSLSNWAEVFASTLYRFNSSSESGFDYEVLETGVVGGVSAKF